MGASLPAITGNQLVRLLLLDGWTELRRSNHGIAFSKTLADGTRLATVIPTKKNKSLPDKTLGDILSMKQTRLGRAGLEKLIDAHGLN